MCKITITLLLNFFRMIYTQNQATIYYQVTTEQETVEKLIEIQHSQSLPLVLIIEKDSTELRHPEFLSKAFTDKGRIINYTQFGRRRSPNKQFLFCPKENSTEKCLVHKEFQPLEPLQCSEEPKPILEVDKTRKCSYKGVGTFYILFYEICADQEPFEFGIKGKRKLVYEICYDSNKNKVLYMTHSILHPKLLRSEVLHYERNMQYDMETMDEFVLSNQQAIEAAMAEESNVSNFKDEQNQKNKKQKTDQHVYRAQKLVPAEDMAFALWRKPTFRYINTELQHEKLIDLWNEINQYIRLHVEKLFVSTKLINNIVTSVMDLDNTPRTDGQISNTWVKAIYFTIKDEINATESITHATVIFVNNYVNTTGLLNWTENILNHYCNHQDFCAESLKKKFEEVGGRVRCCPLTPTMSQLIDVGKIYIIPKIMRIPGIN